MKRALTKLLELVFKLEEMHFSTWTDIVGHTYRMTIAQSIRPVCDNIDVSRPRARRARCRARSRRLPLASS